MLTTQLLDRLLTGLTIPQHRHDLLFTESLLHHSPLSGPRFYIPTGTFSGIRTVLKAKHRPELSRFEYTDEVLARCRALVRLGALLHDVGHAPLSHSGENLMPVVDGQKLDHENYTYWLVREEMKNVIDNHPLNRERLSITGDEVASFYLGKSISPKFLPWRELVAGQLDADRMDYLLRDSHHCGVSYGRYDLERVLDTLVFVEDDSATGIRIGIEDGGRHAAEGLIMARYFMFEQVYFQKTRLAYDHHAALCLAKSLGKGGQLPNPTNKRGRKLYLEMDDWHLFEHIRSTPKDINSIAILQHQHDREIFRTSEVAKPDELKRHDELVARLQEHQLNSWSADASKSWYKTGRAEIVIGGPAPEVGFAKAQPLTAVSETAGKFRDSVQRRIFVPLAEREKARNVLQGVTHGIA